jgi:hypothetical protein
MVGNAQRSIAMTRTVQSRLKTGVALAAIVAQLGLCVGSAQAFCGFYVAKADAKLFNNSSKVVLARNGDETAITMASDYEGTPSEFALVVPVPTFIAKDKISVVEPATVDHLDAYTAPRLVEYYDPDPCPSPHVSALSMAPGTAMQTAAVPVPQAIAYRGVKVEARYDVAEYDVSILSAEESDGLINWLTDNGYKIPAGAEPVVNSYIKQKMHFFVAKVNVKRMEQMGRAYLRPLQVRYNTAKFMLPLRLGTVNANGPQDLIVFALSKRGRVEATNYRTVKVPSDLTVPLFVKNDFANVYKAAFDRAVERENMHGVFVEYAWDMGWCDPCAADPMSGREMADLGAGWGDNSAASNTVTIPSLSATPTYAYVTRLHVRYDAKSFPEDLNFIETADRENFQGRYILQHPYEGAMTCSAGDTYRTWLPGRFKTEAQTLARLTGWPLKDIETRMAANGQPISGTQ